jgi:predicted dehydrogenase
MAVKPHAAALRDLAQRVEVVAGWSPSAERRNRFAATYGFPVIESLDAVLNDHGVDTALILTPPWAHRDLALRCAAAGKHVLLEKPIDATLERAIATVAAFEAARLKLAIVFQHRFRTASLKLAEILRAGRLGRLVSCSASVRWWRGPDYFAQAGRGMAARDGGGVLLTQAIHTLDLFLSLAGPVAELSAFHANTGLRAIDTEDVAAATLRFASGAIGTIDATTAAFPGHPEHIELAGDKGAPSSKPTRCACGSWTERRSRREPAAAAAAARIRWPSTMPPTRACSPISSMRSTRTVRQLPVAARRWRFTA